MPVPCSHSGSIGEPAVFHPIVKTCPCGQVVTVKHGSNMIPLHFAPSSFEVKDDQAQYRGSLYFNNDGQAVSFSYNVTAIRGSWRARMEIDILRETGEHLRLDSQAFNEQKFQGSCRVKRVDPDDMVISLAERSSGIESKSNFNKSISWNAEPTTPLTGAKMKL